MYTDENSPFAPVFRLVAACGFRNSLPEYGRVAQRRWCEYFRALFLALMAGACSHQDTPWHATRRRIIGRLLLKALPSCRGDQKFKLHTSRCWLNGVPDAEHAGGVAISTLGELRPPGTIAVAERLEHVEHGRDRAEDAQDAEQLEDAKHPIISGAEELQMIVARIGEPTEDSRVENQVAERRQSRQAIERGAAARVAMKRLWGRGTPAAGST